MPYSNSIESSKKASPLKGEITKILTVVILAVVVMSAITIVLNNSTAGAKLIPLDGGAALTASGINTTLNTTFTDVNYISEPTQFVVNKDSGYMMYNGVHNETFYNMGAGVTAENSTYQIFNHSATQTTAGFTDLAYNYSTQAGSNLSYFFTAQKLAYNGTSTVTMFASQNPQTATPANIGTGATLTSAQEASGNAAFITVVNGAPSLKFYSAGATGYLNVSTVSFADHAGFSSMNALQFYQASLYIYKNMTKSATGVNISATIYASNNGTVLATAIGHSGTMNATNLHVTEFAFTPTASDSGAGIFDWAYIVNHNTYVSNPVTSSVSPSVSPFISGTVANTKLSLTNAPFDPSSLHNTSYHQIANSTKILTNAAVGQGDFTNVMNATNRSILESIEAQNQTIPANLTAGQSINANETIGTMDTLPEQTASVTANSAISVFNSTNIKARYLSFIQNYTAAQSNLVSNHVNVISDTPTLVQMDTQLPSSTASSIRDALLNEIPSLMAANNLSLVNTTTGSIMAGAFAGDFYYQGMAIVPTVNGNMITNPVNGKTYTLESAGFASGAYISGGAVIVPQLQLVGWDMGSPIFASTSFSFGSIFGGLSSAGSSIGHFFSSGTSSIANGVSNVVSGISNKATSTVKAIGSGISSDISHFKTGLSNVENQIIPTMGTIAGNLQKDISGGLAGINSGVSKVTSTLGSVKNSLATDITSGYNGISTTLSRIGSGVSTSVNSLGSKINNLGQSIDNTLGKTVADTQAVLSPFFTAVKNIPGAIANGTASIASTVSSKISGGINELDAVGTSFYKSVSGKISAEENSLGAIGHSISSGISSEWNFITSIGAKIGFILEIVGITIALVVIVGLILYFWTRRSSGKIPGETSI
ncbi:MAG: hypothetical protein ACYDAP_00375 [Thermoplasmataceae archaeon]